MQCRVDSTHLPFPVKLKVAKFKSGNHFSSRTICLSQNLVLCKRQISRYYEIQQGNEDFSNVPFCLTKWAAKKNQRPWYSDHDSAKIFFHLFKNSDEEVQSNWLNGLRLPLLHQDLYMGQAQWLDLLQRGSKKSADDKTHDYCALYKL